MAPYGGNVSICDTPACHSLAETILKNLAPESANVDPCTDFDQYACAGYIARKEIPPGHTLTSTFAETQDYDYEVVRDVLEGGYTFKDDPGWVSVDFTDEDWKADKDNYDKAKRMYDACMDAEQIKKVGIEPLTKMLKEVADLYPVDGSNSTKRATGAGGNGTAKDLSKAILYFEQLQIPTFLEILPAVDDISVDRFIPWVFPPAALSLPSLALYVDNATLVEYKKVMTGVLQGTHPSKPSAEKAATLAQKILDLELGLFRGIAKGGPQQEDDDSPYLRATLDEVDKMSPSINLPAIFEGLFPERFSVDKFIFAPQPFFPVAEEVIRASDDEAIQAFFIWRATTSLSSVVTSDIIQPWRDFVFDILGVGDTANALPAWRRCVKLVDLGLDTGAGAFPISLGWIVSRFFLEKAYSRSVQEAVNKMFVNIIDTFHTRIQGKDWLTDLVKDRVVEKLDGINKYVGWPIADPEALKPKSVQAYYEKLETSDSHFDNVINEMRFFVSHQWERLGGPLVDYWIQTSATNNAYYTGDFNDVVIPAGIQTSVLFDSQLPGYSQFGFLGVILSHELTHSIDSRGRHFDLDGRHTKWWDDESIEEFENRTTCFVSQFDNYSVEYPIDSGKFQNVDGTLTLPENIADTGGLNIAFETYLSMRKAGEFNNTSNGEEPRLPGLEQYSNEQLFFMMWAQNWCTKETNEGLLSELYDIHSPPGVRIKGPMANAKGFREAYGCKVKEPTCELW